MRKIVVVAAVCLFNLTVFTQSPSTYSSSCVWVSFDGTPDWTPTDVEVLESNSSETVLRVTVHGMCVEDTTVGTETFQVITVPGMTWTSEFGRPELPAISELIALSSKADTVEVTQVTFSIPDTFENYNVWPAQYQSICGDDPAFSIDSTFYSENDDFYPTLLADGDSTNYWHVLPTGHVSIFPFQYNPVDEKLIAYDSLTVTFNHVGPPVTDPIPRSYNEMYEMLINYEDIAGGFPCDFMLFEPHKLFIVWDALINDPSLNQLIEHEKKRGFHVTKKPMSSIGGGPNAANNIKDYIRFYCQSPERDSKAKYVILVGDHFQVPAKIGQFVPSAFRADPDVLSDSW